MSISDLEILSITYLRSSSSVILPRAYSFSLASHSSDNSIPENDMLACVSTSDSSTV